MFLTMAGLRAAIAASGVIAASPVAAAQIEIDGNYGNASGCAFAAGGNDFDDGMFYLTPREVSSYATGCSFLQALRTENGAFVVTVICSHEGEETQTLGLMRIQKAADGSDAYEVFDDDGDLWKKVDRCP